MNLPVAFMVESRKAWASTVFPVATLLVVAGVGFLAGAMMAAVRAGNEQVVAQVGPLAGETAWQTYLNVSISIAAAAVLLSVGVILSWVFGREFADGTAPGLFATAVPRRDTALAKLLVVLLWGGAMAVALTGVVGLVGLVLPLGAIDGAIVAQMSRLGILTVLSTLLATPAAWAATLGRGLLPGIATTIGLVVLAQVGVVAGVGAWVPLAAPALWALDPQSVSRGQLVITGAVPVFFGMLTMGAWARLQLDR